MSLKARVKSLSEVPEAAHSLYTEQSGEYVIAIDGMVTKDKLDEFRASNIELKRQMETLSSKFDGVDLDKYKELSERAQKERDKKLIDAGKVDELVAERVNAMKADYDKQLKTEKDSNVKITKQLEGLVIDNAIRDAATKSGVRATAVDDVLLRGRATFSLQDGKAVALDGDKPIFGKTGEPMEISEWVGGLTDTAPHLFETSQGGGSKNSTGTVVRAGANEIARNDNKSFIKNVDKIAKGEMKVV